MCRQCKLVLHRCPKEIEYLIVIFKRLLQNMHTWQNDWFSLDGAVKIFYTVDG